MTMIKVAIIEDDIAIVQMYRMKFTGLDYKVVTAGNGKDGLVLIEKEEPDIVLLDLMMPVMNGDTMLRELRKTDWGKDIKVIVLTNMGENEMPTVSDDSNVVDYIVKADMTPKQVAEKVRTALSE
jgi:two-component system response regulator MtrA